MIKIEQDGFYLNAMREIKFRVWNTETNKMITNVKEMGVFALQSIYSIDEFLVIPTVEKYPLMQYTGLKDKNGVEVYDGDIIEYDNDTEWYRAKIEWNKYQLHYDVIPVDTKNNIRQLTRRKDTYKVIGNIYKNPELLKEESRCK